MFQYVGRMLEDVTLARTWLLQMGAGAEKAGITIQYCMPFIRHLLHSVEVPAVTQVCVEIRGVFSCRHSLT